MSAAPPPQPAQEYVIAALMEENQALAASKLYLVALLRQLQAEFREAQEVWGLERSSLKASHGEAAE